MVIFLYLILGHLLSDFVFQPDWLIRWKNKNWKGVFIHAFVHFTVEFVLLLPFLTLPKVPFAIAGIVVLHFFIDQLKIRFEHQWKTYVKLFFLDQLAHIIVLSVAAFFIGKVSLSPSLQTYENPYLILYFIGSVLATLGVDIIQLQFLLEKNPSFIYKYHCTKMFKRWIIFSLMYGVAFILFFKLL